MDAAHLVRDIIQQDILLDDIKEYRKIISVLLTKLNNSDDKDCKNILFFSQKHVNTLPYDYEYEYKGLNFIIDDVNDHKEVIQKMMDKLQGSENNYCKELYNECYNSELYQDYYL